MQILNKLISGTIDYVPKSMVELFSKDYIAGETLKDALNVSKDLNAKGIMTTTDVLGETISEHSKAIEYKEECIRLLDELHSQKIDGNLSIKPTQFGLHLDPEKGFGIINEIVEHANSLDIFVRIDMEDRHVTTATLELHDRLKALYGKNVGVVIQAYLRRTAGDIDSLLEKYADKLNVRLCKGIYVEPRKDAYQDMKIINQNFVNRLNDLFSAGAYVGVATHDEYIVQQTLELANKYSYTPDKFEFQMLLGVDEPLRDIILATGNRLRVYIPYGNDWVAYAKRRVKENPKIGTYGLKKLIKIK